MVPVVIHGDRHHPRAVDWRLELQGAGLAFCPAAGRLENLAARLHGFHHSKQNIPHPRRSILLLLLDDDHSSHRSRCAPAWAGASWVGPIDSPPHTGLSGSAEFECHLPGSSQPVGDCKSQIPPARTPPSPIEPPESVVSITSATGARTGDAPACTASGAVKTRFSNATFQAAPPKSAGAEIHLLQGSAGGHRRRPAPAAPGDAAFSDEPSSGRWRVANRATNVVIAAVSAAISLEIALGFGNRGRNVTFFKADFSSSPSRSVGGGPGRWR